MEKVAGVETTWQEPGALGNPWRVTGSREVYANPWVVVREDAVVRPDGAPGIYGVVGFRSLALGAVPLHADGTTVLVGQYRYTLGEWSWEIPEGGGHPDRPPEREMARELAEETGLVARRWTSLGALHTSNSVTDERALLYLAEDLVEGEPAPEPTEQLLRWRLPLDAAVGMALDGRITDAISVAALLRAERLLRERP